MLGRFLFDNFEKILVGIIFWLWFVTVFLSALSLGTKVLTFVGAFVVSGLVGWYGAAFKAWYRGRKQS
jgi:hypothetical protein